MSLVGNERTKLLANALDRASTACFTVGVATPLAAWLYNIGGFGAATSPASLAPGVLGWILAAFVLHMVAQMVLRRLKG
ncbi:MAG: hypothetical protein ACT4OK_11615 [Gemmobacter sp.]